MSHLICIFAWKRFCLQGMFCHIVSNNPVFPRRSMNVQSRLDNLPRDRCTEMWVVKPQKTKCKDVTKLGQVTAKSSMLALQNAPVGVFCNARMLYLVITCPECIYNFIFYNFGFSGFHCSLMPPLGATSQTRETVQEIHVPVRMASSSQTISTYVGCPKIARTSLFLLEPDVIFQWFF